MPANNNLLAAGASAASGLIGGITGLIQMGKGRKLLNSLQYPTETIPDEYLQGQNQANQMAQQGLPSEQYNQAMRNIQRQQLAALRYSNDRRGGLAVIPQIIQGSNDATLNLDAQSAAMRLQNQRYAIGEGNLVGGIKRDIFDKNIRQKYNRDYGYGMSLLGTGNQNFVGGLDKLATGGLIAAGGYKQQPNSTTGGY